MFQYLKRSLKLVENSLELNKNAKLLKTKEVHEYT